MQKTWNPPNVKFGNERKEFFILSQICDLEVNNFQANTIIGLLSDNYKICLLSPTSCLE